MSLVTILIIYALLGIILTIRAGWSSWRYYRTDGWRNYWYLVVAEGLWTGYGWPLFYGGRVILLLASGIERLLP